MSNSSSAILSLRADLIQQRIQMGDRFIWVLKDPLSRAFFYFSDREFSILSLLDGRRRVSEIIAAARQRLAPDFVSAEAVINFLADAKKNGLITSSAVEVVTGREQSSSRPARFQNLLAIRLPGANPDRFLDWIGPILRPLHSPVLLAGVLLAGILAGIMVIANFDDFVIHVGVAATRSSWSWLLVVAVVISLTKIVHEFAHAAACKTFGAECREIGVMFLVGIPCLYCDVSDAWMLPQRYKRILISAAGMFAELTIATAAALLWLFTTDGIVRDICVTTMIVCSISTVLFNGNPLLRYDGYFILSDLLRIPNLAAESSAIVRGFFRRRLWGLPLVVNQSADNNARRTGTLALYGVLSGTYRFFVLAVICLVIYRFTEAIGIGVIGAIAGAWVLFSAARRSVQSIVRPPSALESRSASTTWRPVWVVGLLGVPLLLILLVPLPRSVVAPATIQPSDAVDLFVETPGSLMFAIKPGTDVTVGDRVASLQNEEVENEILAIKTRQSTLGSQLASLKQRRAVDDSAAERIPFVTKALAAADKELVERIAEADRLTIRAAVAGRVFAPPNRGQTPSIENEIVAWQGTPLDDENTGAHLEQGTLLCSIGHAARREAMLLVRQQDIAMIRPRQSVLLITPWRDGDEHIGRVIEVASSPIANVPREFFAAGMVDPSATSELPGSTRETYYQVRVQLDQTSVPLVVRSTLRAKISIGPASIGTRLVRFLSDSFRFELAR